MYTQAAIPEFKKALEIDEQELAPTLISLKAHFNIGSAYVSLSYCRGFEGDLAVMEEAIDAFEAAAGVALGLEPTSEVQSIASQAYYRMGGLYNRLGRPESAIQVLNEAISIAGPPADDLSREPDWKDVRWSAAVRRANSHIIIAELYGDTSQWQYVLDKTDPVLTAYFDNNAFADHQQVVDALYFRGLAYEALEQPTAACQSYHSGVDLQAQVAQPLFLDDVQGRLTKLAECQ
jgi:tetratricopeptide (TPR) repeat protein